MNSNSDSTIVQTSSARIDAEMKSYEYEYDEDEYSNELVNEYDDPELSDDGTIHKVLTENKLSEDSASKGDDADTYMGNTVDSSYSEIEELLTPIAEHDKEAATIDAYDENAEHDKEA